MFLHLPVGLGISKGDEFVLVPVHLAMVIEVLRLGDHALTEEVDPEPAVSLLSSNLPE